MSKRPPCKDCGGEVFDWCPSLDFCYECFKRRNHASVAAPPQHPPSGTVEEKEAREKLTRRVREHFRKGELSEEMLYALEVLAEKAFNFAVDKVAEPLRQQLAEAQKAHEADAVLTGRRAMELAGEIHAAREEAAKLRAFVESQRCKTYVGVATPGRAVRVHSPDCPRCAALSQPEKPAPSGEEK